MSTVSFCEDRLDSIDPLAGLDYSPFDWDQLYQNLGEADATELDDVPRLAGGLAVIFDWVTAGVELGPHADRTIGRRVIALCGLFGHLPQGHPLLRSIGYTAPRGRRTFNLSQRRAGVSQGKAGGPKESFIPERPAGVTTPSPIRERFRTIVGLHPK